jgi:hypothetical protein
LQHQKEKLSDSATDLSSIWKSPKPRVLYLFCFGSGRKTEGWWWGVNC